MQETWVQSLGWEDPLVGKIPWRRAWYPTTVFLPRESPWTEEPGGLQSMGIKESDMTEWLSTARHTVDLQCFRCTVKWLRCTYIIIYMYILFKFFSIIDYRILNIISPYVFFFYVVCICSSWFPNLSLPHPFRFDSQKFVFYVYESISISELSFFMWLVKALSIPSFQWFQVSC